MLAVIATGGGKSICYQIPSLIASGLVVVISPLISLIEDQVNDLKKRGIAAEGLFGGMHRRQVENIIDRCHHGTIRLLYVAPERFVSQSFQQHFENFRVHFVAVDEAHCISQWGHDFRPAYLELKIIKEKFPQYPILALTGTATELVIQDMIQILGLQNSALIRTSTAKSNLEYHVRYSQNKLYAIKEILQDFSGSFIIYTRSRRNTEILSHQLNRNRAVTTFYHAGMSYEARQKAQEKWMNNEVQGIVATSAFGMGINKPDVRFIIHYELPESLEEYVQESGRAGRDLMRSHCILFYDKKELSFRRERLINSNPDIAFIREVYKKIAHYSQIAIGPSSDSRISFDFELFCSTYKLSAIQVRAAISWLVKIGYLGISDAETGKSKAQVLISRIEAIDLGQHAEPIHLIHKALLRLYEGVHITMTTIDEFQIGKLTRIGSPQVINHLQRMAKLDLIRYSEHAQSTEIWFNNYREHSADLVLEEQLYKTLINNKIEKFNQVIEYIEIKACRQVYMAKYFGEKIESCGICDHCIKRKTNRSVIRQSILQDLKKPKSLTALVRQFDYGVREVVLEQLQLLENEKILAVSDQKLVTRIL